MTRAAFPLGDVAAGRSGTVELPLARLVTGAPAALPVRVLHGRGDGPVVWLDAAVHGDEVGGVAVIQRVLAGLSPRTMSGTVIAVPIVNVHGFMTGDRYLPDRRDLNRSFPGSARGSLAARLADLLMREVVARSDVGIDLHTGSDHRANLPQVRADLDDPATRQLAEAFGPALLLHARVRDGSLRHAAVQVGATVLLYEGGEAWRFDDDAITAGTDGVLRVLGALGVLAEPPPAAAPPLVSRSSRWTRARSSGILHVDVELGEHVVARQSLATVTDSFGRRLATLRSAVDGVVIGLTRYPLVNRGDAVAHVAEIVT